MTHGKIFGLSLFFILNTSCQKRDFNSQSQTQNLNVKVKRIEITEAERREYLASADVWVDSNIAIKNTLSGPEGSKALKIGETIECTYVEPSDEKIEGRSRKFYCDKENGERIKVKYGFDNGEVYSEVAASRLLWALGFGADVMHSVRVVCKNCPADPFVYVYNSQKMTLKDKVDKKHALDERATRIFVPAAIEKKFKGVKIVTGDDEGWSWRDLLNFSNVSQERQTHREALALLLSILQHPDSKAENQRLLCPQDGIVLTAERKAKCQKPFAIVQDLGWLFSGGWKFGEALKIRKMDLASWAATPVWADTKTCLTNLNGLPPLFTGTFDRFKVSERGRAFLVGLFSQLTDEQIKGVFAAARVNMQNIPEGASDPDPLINSWANTLKDKMAQVRAVRCPNSLQE